MVLFCSVLESSWTVQSAWGVFVFCPQVRRLSLSISFNSNPLSFVAETTKSNDVTAEDVMTPLVQDEEGP